MNVPTPIHPLDVILHKRDGLVLRDQEIKTFIEAVTHQTISDAQTAAFLMAVFQRGLNRQELDSLTQAMRFSGEVFDSRPLGTFTVDKHSTGGVGDKSSLLIAPILAAAGVAERTSSGVPGVCVPMISGRSLGHTGGTLDKLETIPGFNTQLSLAEMEKVLRRCGAALIGQTPNLVPADRILYALRDHTGTVESPFLITASIMSKKLAESLDALILDVKTGSGAFMRKEEDARLLARLMVETGEAAGTRTVALLTDMSQPLGRYAGNWLEVAECVAILRQQRHPMSRDLIDLSNILAGWMLHLAGRAKSPAEGAALSDEILRSGAAFEAFLSIVSAQGGDVSLLRDPVATDSFHKPGSTTTLRAEQSGFLTSMDCTEVGWAVQRLGAGRPAPGEPVSAHAGIEVHAKLGDPVTAGQPLLTLYADAEAQLVEPLSMLRAAYVVSATPALVPKLVGDVVTLK